MRIVHGNFFMDSIKDFYFQLTLSGILTDWIFRALRSFVFDEKHVFQISNCILSDIFTSATVMQRYEYIVLQTIQMKLIFSCVWAEQFAVIEELI